jgi:serine/threonine-protein kinase
MLTGRRLFQGATDLATLALVRNAHAAPPSISNETVPPELDAICLRALAKDPRDRYATAEAMAADLDEVLHSLRWGVEQTGALVRGLGPLPSPQRHEVEPTPPRTRSSAWLIAAAVTVVLAAGGVVAWVRLRAQVAASPSVVLAPQTEVIAPEAEVPTSPPPRPAAKAPKIEASKIETSKSKPPVRTDPRHHKATVAPTNPRHPVDVRGSDQRPGAVVDPFR